MQTLIETGAITLGFTLRLVIPLLLLLLFSSLMHRIEAAW